MLLECPLLFASTAAPELAAKVRNSGSSRGRGVVTDRRPPAQQQWAMLMAIVCPCKVETLLSLLALMLALIG